MSGRSHKLYQICTYFLSLFQLFICLKPAFWILLGSEFSSNDHNEDHFSSEQIAKLRRWWLIFHPSEVFRIFSQIAGNPEWFREEHKKTYPF